MSPGEMPFSTGSMSIECNDDDSGKSWTKNMQTLYILNGKIARKDYSVNDNPFSLFDVMKMNL